MKQTVVDKHKHIIHRVCIYVTSTAFDLNLKANIIYTTLQHSVISSSMHYLLIVFASTVPVLVTAIVFVWPSMISKMLPVNPALENSNCAVESVDIIKTHYIL